MALPGTPLTDVEWQSAKMWLPELIRDRCSKLGPPSEVYNCIAWSLGYTDRLIETPEPRDEFEAFYAERGWITCPYAEGTIDGFGLQDEDGKFTMQHASRLHEGHWSSKRGADMLMIHHREGMNRSAFYGSICTSFKARPATVSSSTGVTVAASVGESAPLEPQVDVVLRQVVTQTATAFPAVSGDFEKKWNGWQATWHSTVTDPKKFESSSTKKYAAGPEWNALVAMGTKILPEVADKLAQKQNVIGVWLYNAIQTDTTRKVSPKKLSLYYDLTNQANEIRRLYYAQVKAFNAAAAAWATYRQTPAVTQSSFARDKVNNEGYVEIVKMGLPVLPLVMNEYAKDQNGWWHEALDEIVQGKKSEKKEFVKKDLWKQWQEWYTESKARAAPAAA
ncbi:hypothetical protein MMC11_008924 [Xylographa trunciseda]|nr:hypothetical protein [Xylographa trunciseda]